jgi:hypothetical protein
MSSNNEPLHDTIARIHSLAVEALAQPRLTTETKAALQKIAAEALSLSRELSDFAADAAIVRHPQIRTKVWEFLVSAVSLIWRCNNGP